jgi:hypothetical protein
VFFAFFSATRAASHLILKGAWVLKQAAQLLLLVKSSHGTQNSPNRVTVMSGTDDIYIFGISSKFRIQWYHIDPETTMSQAHKIYIYNRQIGYIGQLVW